MSEFITVTGARENNLRDVSVRVPKRQITAFVGVSGSGKSSLVFDTIAAEAQRQLNETFSAFVRGFLPKLGQPDADLIENLSTAIVVDQKRLGGGVALHAGHGHRHQPAAAAAVVAPQQPARRVRLRVLVQRAAGHVPGLQRASAGRCSSTTRVFFDRTRSLNEGAILHRDFAVDSWYWHIYAQSGRFDNDKPLRDYTDDEWQLLLFGADEKVALTGPGRKAVNMDFEGVETKFNRLYIDADEDGRSERKKETSPGSRRRCAARTAAAPG